MKKVIGIIALLMVMVLMLASCGQNDGNAGTTSSQTDGTWTLISGTFQNTDSNDTRTFMIKLDSGDAILTMTDGRNSISAGTSYRIEGNKFIYQPINMLGNPGPEQTYEFSLNGNTMTLTGNGETGIFRK